MITILLIEDSDDLRSDVRDLLALEGYQVLEANDGINGVETALRAHPHIILCDVMMPRMDGYAVLKALRARPETATIPFIFLTSRGEHESQRTGMRLGADDYLPKPFRVSDLLDIIRTQLRKQEEIRAEAGRQLEDLRMNIITAMPHELRTPLNTILGFSEMLMSEAAHLSAAQVAAWGQYIHDAGMRVLRMTENYLTYARVSVALNDPQQRSRARQERVEDAVGVIREQALATVARHERSGTLMPVLEAALPLRIDARDLQRIVDELIDNACKFSPLSSPIYLAGRVVEGQYVVRVVDEGRGISPEYLTRVGAYMQFERWLYEQQGSGLGLSIVVQLVRLYDGVLDVESAPGAGTAVTVRLPLYQNH